MIERYRYIYKCGIILLKRDAEFQRVLDLRSAKALELSIRLSK